MSVHPPLPRAAADPFALGIAESVSRMVSDLRLGLPAVLTGPEAGLIVPAETLSPDRLAAFGRVRQLVVTSRRAEAPRHRPHEGDVALPPDARLDWVRAMTNNPAKIARLHGEGIGVVERVPLQIGRGPENARYLDTKARKSGHLLA